MDTETFLAHAPTPTADEEPLRAFVERELSRPEDRLRRLQLLVECAESWTDPLHVAALASTLGRLTVTGPAEETAFCAVCVRLADRSPARLFGDEVVRRRLLTCLEAPGTARVEASGAFVRLCRLCLRDPAADRVVSSFVRFLVVPLRRLLRDESASLQCVANAAQIIAARCASQSFDKNRQPDEVVLLAEAGLFDDLGVWLGREPALQGPIMNAVQGLMVSGAALEFVSPSGSLAASLKPLRERNKQASTILDAIELVAFKRVVAERAKARGDGGQSMGNEFLGVLNAAGGPKQMGFEFSNPEMEKGFKDMAFREGVIKPMARKMEEEGEAPLNVDSIARTVLGDFTKPKPGCEVCSREGTKRCGACKAVYYCSAEHQRVDWDGKHRAQCRGRDQ